METILTRVDEKIEEDPGDAMEVISTLWKIANGDGSAVNGAHDTEAPLSAPLDVSILRSYFTACVI